MANKKSKKTINSLSYIESEMLVFQELAFKTQHSLRCSDVFDDDDPKSVQSKKDFTKFYESLDEEAKNQIEGLLNLIRKDIKVKGVLGEDKIGFFGLYTFETDTEKYQIRIDAPESILRMITPEYFQGTWYLPGFSLAELYQEACK